MEFHLWVLLQVVLPWHRTNSFSFNAITTIGVGDVDGGGFGYTCLVVAFVIVGLAVITMCVDLASTQVKMLFEKLHYFGRQLKGSFWANCQK